MLAWPDAVVAASSAAGFSVFLVMHIFLFRLRRYAGSSGMISISIRAGLIVCVLIFAKSVLFSSVGSFGFTLFCAGLTVLLYVLLVFHYIAWFFGMGESALRIRILHELAGAGSEGLSLEELYRRYNAPLIFKTRMDRFLNTGHLRREGDRYRLGNPIFLWQIRVSRFLGSLLGARQSWVFDHGK